jgi:hypothetical protein
VGESDDAVRLILEDQYFRDQNAQPFTPRPASDRIAIERAFLDMPTPADSRDDDRVQSFIRQAGETARQTPWARNIDMPAGVDPYVAEMARQRATGQAVLQRARSLGRPFGAEEQASLGQRPFAPRGTRYAQDENIPMRLGLDSGPEDILRAIGESDQKTKLIQKDKTRELIAFAVAMAAATAATGGAASAFAAPYLGATGAAVAGGAAAGATGSIGQGLYNQNLDWKEILLGTGLGGASAGAGAYARGLGTLGQLGVTGATAAGGKAITDAVRGRPFDPYGVGFSAMSAMSGPAILAGIDGSYQLPQWVRAAIAKIAAQSVAQAGNARKKEQ